MDDDKYRKTRSTGQPVAIDSADDRKVWGILAAHDRELHDIRRRNAVAARNIAIRHESAADYGEWVREYQQAGDRLHELYARRASAKPR